MYLKVDFFGWLFVSYTPLFTSTLPSSFLGNTTLYLFNRLVVGVLLTCLTWNSSKNAIWVDVNEGIHFFPNRVVNALFPPLPFCTYRTIWRRWNKSSCYICFCLIFFCNFDMYLLFILRKSVNHNQLLFCLELSFFFPITLILSTLLNFPYSYSLRLEYQRGYINSGLTHCIKNFVVEIKIDEMGCVA